MAAPRDRATVSFVSTHTLTSSDGIQHDKVKPVADGGGTMTASGLEVRPKNRDLEKLDQRAAGGGTSMTLYEQLQQNKEDKEEELEQQLREGRMPKALDEDEIAFLEEQRAEEELARAAHLRQEAQDIAAFRAGRAAAVARQASGAVAAGKRARSTVTRVAEISAAASALPQVRLKKRRRQPPGSGAADAAEVGMNKPGPDAAAAAKRTPPTAVLSLAAYQSSSSDEED